MGSPEDAEGRSRALSGRGVPIDRLADLALAFVEAVRAHDPHALARGLDLAAAIADAAEELDHGDGDADAGEVGRSSGA